MNGVLWYSYPTGTPHAFYPGESDSVCGSALARRKRGAGSEERLEGGCGNCTKKLAQIRRRASGSSSSETTSGPRREHHRDGKPCPCRKCRDGRREVAEKYIDEVREGIEDLVCACVREWSGSAEIVAAAEARLGGVLLGWEMSDVRVGARDVEDAARGLRAAWREARDRYDLLDGSHPRRLHRRGRTR